MTYNRFVSIPATNYSESFCMSIVSSHPLPPARFKSERGFDRWLTRNNLYCWKRETNYHHESGYCFANDTCYVEPLPPYEVF